MSSPHSDKSIEQKSEKSLDLWADEVSEYEEDDVECARERTDSDIKSEEILCNYGDNVLLEDSSEDVTTAGPYKPAKEERLTRVRIFTGKGKVTTANVFFDVPSGDESDKISESKLELNNTSPNSSSFAPSRSYSSFNGYLKSLKAKKRSSKARGNIKSAHSIASNSGSGSKDHSRGSSTESDDTDTSLRASLL